MTLQEQPRGLSLCRGRRRVSGHAADLLDAIDHDLRVRLNAAPEGFGEGILHVLRTLIDDLQDSSVVRVLDPHTLNLAAAPAVPERLRLLFGEANRSAVR